MLKSVENASVLGQMDLAALLILGSQELGISDLAQNPVLGRVLDWVDAGLVHQRVYQTKNVPPGTEIRYSLTPQGRHFVTHVMTMAVGNLNARLECEHQARKGVIPHGRP